jgi:hypothetical protein
MLDRAVLAGAVAPLEHHHHAIHLGAPQRVLQFEELRAERFKALSRLFLGDPAGRLGRNPIEADFLSLPVEDRLGHPP